MKKRKAILGLLLVLILTFGGTLSVWGADTEWYELYEIEDNSTESLISKDELGITPYSRYILGAQAIMQRPSSSVLWMRSEVYCTETMSKITTTFTLQKKSGSSWVKVGQGTVSVSNDNSMYKSMEATGASSGTYRCVADTRVTSKSGYSETFSTISNTV